MLTLAVTTLFNSLDPGEFTISSSYRVADPGRHSRTIIVEMSSNDHCLKILKKKRIPKDKSDYEHVYKMYIETNRPRHERQIEANMRRICKKVPNLEFKRGRVMDNYRH